MELTENGVGLLVWELTYDGFLGWYACTDANGGLTHRVVDAGGESQVLLCGLGIALIVVGFLQYPPFVIVGVILLSCVACCSGNRNQGMVVSTFSRFLTNQQEIYAPYNIRVTSDGTPRFPVLVFDTCDLPYRPPLSADINSGDALVTVTTTGPTLAQHLTSLHDLNKAGALTNEEYIRAKERVISNASNNSESPEDSATGAFTNCKTV